MYGLFDISTSGMVAQRTRLEAASANLANQNSVLDAKTGKIAPYRRREVMLAPGTKGAGNAQGSRSFGVHIAQIAIDQSPPQAGEFNPSSELAYKDGPLKGYIAKTGIDPTIELVNSMEAVRAYEANITAAESTKQMVASALRLLA